MSASTPGRVIAGDGRAQLGGRLRHQVEDLQRLLAQVDEPRLDLRARRRSGSGTCRPRASRKGQPSTSSEMRNRCTPWQIRWCSVSEAAM